MSYYHIFIDINGDEKEEHDLNKKELESFVESYHKNEKFMCGGSFVQPSEIETIQIYETQETLEAFLKAKMPLFSVFMPDSLILEKYGKNVTKLFIKHPPKKRRTRKVTETKKKKNRERDKGMESEWELSIPKEVWQKLPKKIQRTIEGVKLCYEHDHADFCFMGMRKALSTAIHIRFGMEGKEEELYDSNGEPYKLTKWIEQAKQNRFLSASLAKKLDEVKVFGDIGSHDYRIDFHKEDVPSIFKLLRLALDRMYHEREKVQKQMKRKPAKSSVITTQRAFAGEKFDLARFKTNLRVLNGVSDSETRYKLLERIRHQTTDLPCDGMPDDVRNDILHLLLILKKEVGNEKMRRLCLDILHIINGRRDNEVDTKIKELFLSWMEDNYQDFAIEEKHYAMDIQQRLSKYNPNFIKELMLDSVNKWSLGEFEELYREIEFDRLAKSHTSELKFLLWKLRDEANKKQLGEKLQRIDKLLKLYAFR